MALFALLVSADFALLRGGVIINEIMVQPAGVPENSAEEWVEIFNNDGVDVDLGGWKFAKGVTFTFPAIIVPAGGYLIVASDADAFRARNPAFSGAMVSGWTGKLSNSGETLRLENSVGAKVHEVTYADEGAWALRARGPLMNGHRGWVWVADHAGTGRTLELRNPAFAAEDTAQNWQASSSVGGTPGAPNSTASTDISPLILELRQTPQIPRSSDPISVSARIADESSESVSAHLRWRLDGSADFNSIALQDLDNDGLREATIPPQANGTIIEFYVEATDASGNTRTLPAPARTSAPGETPETFAQAANFLLQVDDSYHPETRWVPGDRPIYRLLMTAVEAAELARIGALYAGKPAGEQQSDAVMNATFISQDGLGIHTCYSSGVRNRGTGSRIGPPNNYHVDFPHDDLWFDRSSFQLNCRYPHSQALGALAMNRAGIPPQESVPVRVRVNGQDLAETNLRMYGTYARNESLDKAWLERHFPADPNGNLYALDDHAPAPVGAPAGNLGTGEFRYEGTNPLAYSDTFLKDSNADLNDWNDLINLTRIVSAPATGGSIEQPAIPDEQYVSALSAVMNIDEVLTFFATDALIGNQEGGLQSGRSDDATLYRGIADPRFILLPHDLDSVFGLGLSPSDPGGPGAGPGVGNPVTRSIFTYEGVLGLRRIFSHPQLASRYYAKLLEQMDSWFNRATLDPIINEAIGAWVAPAQVANVKTYIDQRRANVLSQIPQTYSLNVATSAPNVEGLPRTLDGSATFSGEFNVAKAKSVTVNGLTAELSYRPGAYAAGTWRLSLAADNALLQPGWNNVSVTFWDSLNGSGHALQTLTTRVLKQPQTPVYSGAGSLRLIAPATYLPGKPFLVRVDRLNEQGELDRTAWNTTAVLTTSAGSATLPPVMLYNGVGSALITLGGGSSGPAQQLILPGGTANFPNANAPQWRHLDSGAEPAAEWKSAVAFDDSTWNGGRLQAGAGDGDERTMLINVPNSASNTRRAFYFRKPFTVTDPASLGSLVIKAVVDDGAIFYLNGTEVYRDNMPSGVATLTTPASSNRAGTDEAALRSFDISGFLPLLRAGENLLAVEVHNYSSGNTYSVDLSFDCQLTGTPSTNPGNLTLTANANGFTASRAMNSLGVAPAMTEVSGTLPAGVTTWNGVVHVTGDTILPADGSLVIEAGAHVLFDGDSIAGSTSGKRLIVNGTLISQGTSAQPVCISAFGANDRWGQIVFANAQPSRLSYTFLSHAGHSPGNGHTGRGAMLRLQQSNLTFADSILADGPAKAMYSSGACEVNITRSLIERMITGPELEDGVALLIEDSNIQRILPDYRESNAAVPDDEDCLYVHNTSGRSVLVRRSVFARCGDDLFDCLGGPITVEDSILREAWDKGMSLLDNDLTISRTQIVQCDKAIVPKSSVAARRLINALNCTIVSEDHDTSKAPWGYPVAPNGGDPDSASTGFYTQNKAGQSNSAATLSITATNCIVLAHEPVKIDAPYTAANTVVRYSDLFLDTGAPFSWPGVGNISVAPQFVRPGAGDYHLQAASPARDVGDPASSFDPDGSRADLGALPFTASTGETTITWTPSGGPYRITADRSIPAGSTLIIQPGTSVYFDAGKRLTIQGRIVAQGTADARISFSHVPGVIAEGDCDPLKNGVQTGPSKWAGIRVEDSLAQESVFSFCDFTNAQGNPQPQNAAAFAGSENWGALGFIRSWGRVENCTWNGTHLRMCYARNSKVTVTRCTFPDMFVYDAQLAREENPSDFPAAANGHQEQVRIEYPTADPELAGNGSFNANGFPLGGWLRLYENDFHGNMGSNDVLAVDCGRLGAAGDFILDCRYNHFHGPAGDEHLDLRGDALIASNIFERAAKDIYTSDGGDSNAISVNDSGTAGTVMVARNIFFDLDHAINLEGNAASIFEHNTVADVHPDSIHEVGDAMQSVQGSAISLYVPGNVAPTAGDGAYLGFNLFSALPRLVSGADNGPDGAGSKTSKLQFNYNLVDQVTDLEIGSNHSGGIYNVAYGINAPGRADFTDRASGDFTLKLGSGAREGAPGGFDYGSTISEWAYIIGGPEGETRSHRASFVIGGPGMVAYKWRIDSGAWSVPTVIGSSGVFSRTESTVRQTTLSFTDLADGVHTLQVLGQDFAGNWQDVDPAKSLTAQSAPTARTWTVNPAASPLRLNEILSRSDTGESDRIELQNTSDAPVATGGWSITDDPAIPQKFPLPAGVVASGDFAAPIFAGLALDADGDSVYLYQNGILRDSVSYGPQIADRTIGRLGANGAWGLCKPTFGAQNVAQHLGDPRLVMINEWFSDGDVLYDNDWIELANPGELPVALAGLCLTDNPVSSHNQRFPDLSFIAAGGFARFIADGNLSTGPSHVGFSLDAQAETIALLDSENVVIDLVFFYPQVTDRSQGRDSAGEPMFFELPTRGFANGATDPAYANALAVLRGLRITEIMYSPVGGSEFEYIELRNIGGVALQLAGVRVVQGIDFTFPTMSLGSGESVLAVANLARFRSRYGNGPKVAGVYSGKLDNSGESLGLQLAPPFDAKVLNFAFTDVWQRTANGLGKSLVVESPDREPNTWGAASTWVASASSGGDPDGYTISAPDHFAAWRSYYGVIEALNDDDSDGLSNDLEFALGTSPVSASGLNGVAGLPQTTRSPDGRLEFHFWLPENLTIQQTQGLPEVTYAVQASSDLKIWETVAMKTGDSNWSGQAEVFFGQRADGFVPITIRDRTTSSQRFFRLQSTLQP